MRFIELRDVTFLGHRVAFYFITSSHPEEKKINKFHPQIFELSP
jgi:hypothetical protein